MFSGAFSLWLVLEDKLPVQKAIAHFHTQNIASSAYGAQRNRTIPVSRYPALTRIVDELSARIENGYLHFLVCRIGALNL